MWKQIGRSKAPKWTGIATAMQHTMNTTVKRRLNEYPKKVTGDWDHEPDFPVKREDKGGAYRLVCVPAGPNMWYWIWTTQGTREHDIEPVNASMLAFPSMYTPHTRPGRPPAYGGPGKSSGSTIFTMHVDHPGTTPRRLVGAWVDEAKAWFIPAMRDSVKRGVRKA